MKKLLLIYTGILILLAVLPINSSESILNDNYILHFRLDYILHFAIFMPWMVIAWPFFNSLLAGLKLKIPSWFLAGTALAAGTECIQYFLPYRAFNINDLTANLIGIFLGSIITFFLTITRK